MVISLAANILVLALAIRLALSSCRKERIELRYPELPFSVFRRIVGFGSLMALNSLSGVFLYQIQRFLIAYLIGPAGVTLYQLAMTVPAKAHAVVNSITQVMFPLASSEKDHQSLRRVYLGMLLGSGTIALLLLVPLAVFAQPLMTLWVGAELATQVAPLLPLFALSFAFLALSTAPYHVVNGLGKPWLNTISYAFNATINVAMIAVFAIDEITLTEFAWAFAIANVLNGLLYQAVVEITIWRRGPLARESLHA
jgi:O-antigen/teichoic acid export membrane protein